MTLFSWVLKLLGRLLQVEKLGETRSLLKEFRVYLDKEYVIALERLPHERGCNWSREVVDNGGELSLPLIYLVGWSFCKLCWEECWFLEVLISIVCENNTN